MRLFKYTSWQPFNSSDELIDDYFVKENLLNHQLYYNLVEKFNDPFDLFPCLELKATKHQLIDYVTLYLRENDRRKLPPKEEKKRAASYVRKLKLHTEEGRSAAIEKLRKMLLTIGVCCFTINNPRTILMWSHYGDQHRGICHVFDFPDTMFNTLNNVYFNVPPIEKNEIFKIPESELFKKDISKIFLMDPNKISYNQKLPKINVINNTNDQWYQSIMTKSTEWEYENEYRSITLNHIGLIQYNPTVLKAIIAGCKMSKRDFDELERTILSMKYPPRLYKAERKADDYGLDLFDSYGFPIDEDI